MTKSERKLLEDVANLNDARRAWPGTRAAKTRDALVEAGLLAPGPHAQFTPRYQEGYAITEAGRRALAE